MGFVKPMIGILYDIITWTLNKIVFFEKIYETLSILSAFKYEIDLSIII